MAESEKTGSTRQTKCPHVVRIGDVSWDDINARKKMAKRCETCGCETEHLWLCLDGGCLYVGCGNTARDDSDKHGAEKGHVMFMNLCNRRIWCGICQSEVLLNNVPPFSLSDKRPDAERTIKAESSTTEPRPPVSSDSCQSNPQGSGSDASLGYYRSSTHELDAMDVDAEKLMGTLGLYNLGNTCYMNAALQALSNCPPLSDYFLYSPTNTLRETNSLSGAFTNLLTEIWQPTGQMRCLLPKVVLDKMRRAYPIFQGHSQHDSQEFLRCFLDQLNEEMKRPVHAYLCDCVSDEAYCETVVRARCRRPSDSASDYDTCDSGLTTEDDDDDEGLEYVQASTAFSAVDEMFSCERDSSSEHSSRDSGYSRLTPEISNDIQQTNPALPLEDDDDESSRESKDKQERSGSVEARKRVRLPGKKVRPGGRESSDRKKRQPSSPLPGKRKVQKYTSIISEVFDGQMINSVECLSCHQVSCSLETYHELSVPIPNDSATHEGQDSEHGSLSSERFRGSRGGRRRRISSSGEGAVLEGGSWVWQTLCSVVGWFWRRPISLSDCFLSYFSAEELRDENKYYCEHCRCTNGRMHIHLRNGLKFSQILKLPEILCIQLNRFKQQLNYISKIDSYVSFPINNLDMKPYLHTDAKVQMTSYDLVAVICHDGSTRGGHYTTYAFNERRGQWFDFNDDYVLPVSASTVSSSEAYILFYRKKSIDSDFYRGWFMDCQRDLNLNGSSAVSKTHYISSHWIHRFWTFADPGPITNQDFLCSHLNVQATVWSDVENFVTPVSEYVWERLVFWFGGGPAVTSLTECLQCKQERERLRERQKTEIETVWKMYNEYSERKELTGHIYALSLAWFERWRHFAQGNSSEDPGPIDNTSISVPVSGSPGSFTLRPNMQFANMTSEQWFYLLGIYGGGPEVIATRCPTHAPQVRRAGRNVTISTSEDSISHTSDVESIADLPAEDSASGLDQSQQTSAEEQRGGNGLEHTARRMEDGGRSVNDSVRVVSSSDNVRLHDHSSVRCGVITRSRSTDCVTTPVLSSCQVSGNQVSGSSVHDSQVSGVLGSVRRSARVFSQNNSQHSNDTGPDQDSVSTETKRGKCRSASLNERRGGGRVLQGRAVRGRESVDSGGVKREDRKCSDLKSSSDPSHSNIKCVRRVEKSVQNCVLDRSHGGCDNVVINDKVTDELDMNIKELHVDNNVNTEVSSGKEPVWGKINGNISNSRCRSKDRNHSIEKCSVPKSDSDSQIRIIADNFISDVKDEQCDGELIPNKSCHRSSADCDKLCRKIKRNYSRSPASRKDTSGEEGGVVEGRGAEVYACNGDTEACDSHWLENRSHSSVELPYNA